MILCLLGALCAVAIGTAAATAASSKSTTPTVKAIKPATLGIGDTLTIRGTGFVSGKLKNWVVFQRDRSRPVFLRADIATKTEIRIKVPEKLRPYLRLKAGKSVSTRFRIRVLARSFGEAFTATGLSPVIGPNPLGGTKPTPDVAGDCDKDGIKNSAETDDDGDGLSDVREKALKTDPCNADTDADGINDYFEVESALDLNSRVNFYPVKRPYPNPLYADADTDFDGDGMTQRDEYYAWVRYGGSKPDLNYSDGCQDTRNGGCSGPGTPVPAGQPWLDIDGNGVLADDEKDVDGDGLGNWDEAHGRMVYAYWKAVYETEKPYAPQYGAVDFLDPDSDGDGLPDGGDDQDYDDLNNISELNRGPYWVQPFNPCLPNWKSRTCSKHPPITDSWPPFGKAYSVDPAESQPLVWPRPVAPTS